MNLLVDDFETGVNYGISEIINQEYDMGLINIIDVNSINTDCINYELSLRLNSSNSNVVNKTLLLYRYNLNNQGQLHFSTNPYVINSIFNNLSIYGGNVGLEDCNMEGTISFLVTSNFTTESSTQQSQTTSKQSK